MVPFLLEFGSQLHFQSISPLFERQDAHQVDSSPDQQQRFHISSWQTSHFHFKKETTLLWLELPLPTPRSCFWSFIAFLLYYVKVWGDGREQQVISRKPSYVLRIHQSTGCLAASRRCVCGAGSVAPRCTHTNSLPWKRKQAPLAKKSCIGGCFLWGNKTTPVLPALKSHPVFHEDNTFRFFLAVSVDGCELRVQFHLIPKAKPTDEVKSDFVCSQPWTV